MEKVIVDNLKKFGLDFQIRSISCLLSDKSFLERIVDILDINFWELDAHKWIVNTISHYFLEYKDLPTLIVFKVQMDNIDTEELKKSIIEQLKLVYQKISSTDIKYVKEQFLEFAKNQKLKSAIEKSCEYLQRGQYDSIKHIVDEALKAGMERNVGHDYMIDVDKRMTHMVRDCVKTNWPDIDVLLDGGLGRGELGIITGAAGLGKCVGPNTEIEIQYEEIGIPVIGNSGKEYIVWISPFKKYEINDEVLYGWQIYLILESLEQEKVQKK